MNRWDEPGGPGEEPRTSSAGDRLPPDEGTVIMERAAAGGAGLSPTAASAPGAATGSCPNAACRQPIGPDVRFCQACGTALREERPRPWLILVGLAWLLLAMGAYLLLYSSAFVIGRP